MKKNLKIYSLIFWMKDEGGHHFEYNRYFQKAANLNGWKFQAYIPYGFKGKIPKDWKKKLFSVFLILKPNIFKRILKPFLNIFPLYKILKRAKGENAYILIEDFGLVELFVFLLSSLFCVYRSNLILVFRYVFCKNTLKGKISKILFFLLKKIFKKNLILFTDSEIIQKKLKCFFKVNILPIPHTKQIIRDTKKILKKEKLFLWPGRPREDKGLKNIKILANLLKTSKKNKNIKLVLTETDEIQKDKNIKFLKPSLPRKDYEKWMQISDLILLPYLQEEFHSRTSGIFVEAISFLKKVIVLKNTWMAHELKKFDLKELIIDWKKENLLENLEKIEKDLKIDKKIKHMQKSYIQFHSLKFFSKILKEQIKN